jgi:hypothetical protein
MTTQTTTAEDHHQPMPPPAQRRLVRAAVTYAVVGIASIAGLLHLPYALLWQVICHLPMLASIAFIGLALAVCALALQTFVGAWWGAKPTEEQAMRAIGTLNALGELSILVALASGSAVIAAQLMSGRTASSDLLRALAPLFAANGIGGSLAALAKATALCAWTTRREGAAS